uniref:Uncharacterized protein n=1 Tax=Haemonchus contortus TaxID=6289 RepID=A0A7I4YFW2_HAECO
MDAYKHMQDVWHESTPAFLVFALTYMDSSRQATKSPILHERKKLPAREWSSRNAGRLQQEEVGSTANSLVD